jgi:dTDP-4-dehydrorhamnose reductase
VAKVLVLGASGLLGSSLVPYLRERACSVDAYGGRGVDGLLLSAGNSKSVLDVFFGLRPEVVVNLIAATDVDKCEDYPEWAWKTNIQSVEVIVECIEKVARSAGVRAHLIQISTDQVYSGIGPHYEADVCPVNVYGMSKYAGELVANRVGATILRSNFFGRSRCTGRVSFSDWIISGLKKREKFTVFDDIKFNPVHINTLCEFIYKCIKIKPKGTFNVGCRDAITKADFAIALADALSLPLDAVAIGSAGDARRAARRPFDMSMRISGVEQRLQISCPYLSNEIIFAASEYMGD